MVTASTEGIGLAIAQNLGKHGASVMVSSRKVINGGDSIDDDYDLGDGNDEGNFIGDGNDDYYYLGNGNDSAI